MPWQASSELGWDWVLHATTSESRSDGKGHLQRFTLARSPRGCN